MTSTFSPTLTIAIACDCAMVLVAAAAVEVGLLPMLSEGTLVGAAAALGSAMPLALVQAAATAAAAADSALAVLKREAAVATLERAQAPAELAAAAAALADALQTHHDLQAATLLAGVLMPKLPVVAKEVAAMDALAQADTEAQLDDALAGAAEQGNALMTLLSPAQVAVPLLGRTVAVMLADVMPFLALLERGWKLVAAQAARLGEGHVQRRAPC